MAKSNKEDLDELYKNLQEEESNCEHCGYWTEYGNAACDGCATHGNIQDMKMYIADLEGRIEDEQHTATNDN